MLVHRLGCWLLALGCVAAYAADDLTIEAQRNGAVVEVRARATIDAPLSIIWTTLTDYERLPEFIPGLKKSRVVSRSGQIAVVEQSGEARFLFFSFPIEVMLEALEIPPSLLRVRALSGTLRLLEGSYQVEPDPDSPKLVLRWAGSIVPDVHLPPLLGEVVMRASIEDQFTGIVREIERREAVRRAKNEDSQKK